MPARVAEKLAEPQPLVLLFEDNPLAEDALLELVEHMATWVRNVPILLVCLARPELRPEAGVGRRESARDVRSSSSRSGSRTVRRRRCPRRRAVAGAREALLEKRWQSALRRGDDPDALEGDVQRRNRADPGHAPGADCRADRPASARREGGAPGCIRHGRIL